jgi:signal transduction histidine kinase
MQAELARPFDRISFSRQFLLLSLGMLTLAMLVVGLWLQELLEQSAANRAASGAALYVEAILSEQLKGAAPLADLDTEARQTLDRLFVDGPLGQKVVRFKLWSEDGKILYCSDATQIGKLFSIDGLRAAAFAGEMQARVSSLDQVDNYFERAQWSRLLEVYVPVRAGLDGPVIAVAEFYHSAANLSRDIRAAQMRSWALVAGGTIVVYLLLVGLVRRADNTILGHQRVLRRQLRQLRGALAENERMRDRLSQAGARSTALNEQFLHRVAADLHDGPAQDAALALLRLDALAELWTGCAAPYHCACADLEVTRQAMRSCLDELRHIASGLNMPELKNLSLADTARRAVRDYERKSGAHVELDLSDAPDAAPIPVKITVFRLLQEALTNGWRHAKGSPQEVRMALADGEVVIEVTDRGPGFDCHAESPTGRLGLAFMNERVRLLGGVFEVDTAPGCGTRVRGRLPLSVEETAYV